jgi:hypothetical protein
MRAGFIHPPRSSLALAEGSGPPSELMCEFGQVGLHDRITTRLRKSLAFVGVLTQFLGFHG